MRPDQYQEWALEAVRGILEQEHAVIWSEVEARAFDLVDDRKRAVADAAACKRLLQARFLGWAKGTRRHPRGLIGGAGETVVAASLEAAAGTGYQLLYRDRGEVRKLFGQPVAGGPLDNAAHLIVIENDAPAGVVTVVVEVKNVRQCLYPTAVEIYQLLYKASRLQVDHPQRTFVPVLVCRRAHKTLFRMAKAFGFYVIDSRRQFITPSSDVSDEQLSEVRTELAYADLVKHSGPGVLVTKHFRTHLPREAAAFAERWAGRAAVMEPTFKAPPNSW